METVSDVKFECDQCRQRIEAPGDMLGASIVCPKCGASLTVPLPEAARESAPTKRSEPSDPSVPTRPFSVRPAIRDAVPQTVVSAGVAGLLFGLFLVSREAPSALYLFFFLTTLAAGAVACRKKLPVIGATLALAAVIAPLFARPPAGRTAPQDDPPDWTTELTLPESPVHPVVPLDRSPVSPHHAPTTGPVAAVREDDRSPTRPVPEPADAPASARTLSPTFSDDPFRDVFGPPADEPAAPREPTEPSADESAAPREPTSTDATAPVGAVVLDSDRICQALIRTPDDITLLAKLRKEIGAIANEEKKIRLAVAYALGCLYTGNRQEARLVQGYLHKHYPDHPLATHLSAERTLSDCARCTGAGTNRNPCPECNGEGRCSGCGGTGQRTLPGLDGTTRPVGCVTCRGSGECRRCKGDGRVETACPACRGTGKVLAVESIRKAYWALLADETPE